VNRAALGIALAAAGCSAPPGSDCGPRGDVPPPVSVRVVDEAGAPVAGAEVEILGSQPDYCRDLIGPRRIGRGETDANGQATVALGPGARAALVTASTEGRPLQMSEVIADQAILVLGARRAVHGQIAGEGCEHLAIEVEVSLVAPPTVRDEHHGKRVASATAGADGVFVVDGLGPGHYRATARACDQVLTAEFTGRDETITLR
jgi:hypothetical protein